MCHRRTLYLQRRKRMSCQSQGSWATRRRIRMRGVSVRGVLVIMLLGRHLHEGVGKWGINCRSGDVPIIHFGHVAHTYCYFWSFCRYGMGLAVHLMMYDDETR